MKDFQPYFHCACTETAIYEGENFDTGIRFVDPDFVRGEWYFGDLKTFSVDFCIRYALVRYRCTRIP